jgi:sugar-specific transcriptional regulator TrmB
VYLELSQMEEASVLALSKKSETARQEIYRVVNELHTRGLVEKIIANPARYKAVSVKDAITHLLILHAEEKNEVFKKARQMVERHNFKKKPNPTDNEIRFLLISKKIPLSRKIKEAIESSQESIMIVTPRSEFFPALFDLSQNLKEALEKGLTVKWITGKPVNSDLKPAVLEALSKYSRFKLSFLSQTPKVGFGIYDKKFVIIGTGPKLNYIESPAVWTNSLAFVELAIEYFIRRM